MEGVEGVFKGVINTKGVEGTCRGITNTKKGEGVCRGVSNTKGVGYVEEYSTLKEWREFIEE